MELKNKRVTVTGGGGFLGRYVIRSLKNRGCTQIFIPRRSEYDLSRENAVEKLYRDARPDVVIHLAGVVAGIGPGQGWVMLGNL